MQFRRPDCSLLANSIAVFWIAQLFIPFSSLQSWYFTLSGYRIPWAYAVFLAVNALLILLTLASVQNLRLRDGWWIWLLLAASVVPGVATGVDTRWGIRHILVFMTRGFLAGLILSIIKLNRDDYIRLAKIICWSAIVMASVGMIEILCGKPILADLYHYTDLHPLAQDNPMFRAHVIGGGTGGRSLPVGGVGNRTPFTACLVAFLPLLLWHHAARKGYFYLLGAALLVAVIVLSLSRGSWLGALVAVGLYTFTRRPDTPARIQLKIIVLLAAVVFAVLLIPKSESWRADLRQKFDIGILQTQSFSLNAMKDTSVAYRLANYATVWRIFKTYPLGIGLGNYPTVYKTYQTYAGQANCEMLKTCETPDNQFLRWLAETGIPGIGALLIFLAFLTQRIFSGYPISNGADSDHLCAIYAGTAGLLVCFLFFDGFYWSACATTFWCLTGLAWAQAGSNLIKSEDTDRAIRGSFL